MRFSKKIGLLAGSLFLLPLITAPTDAASTPQVTLTAGTSLNTEHILASVPWNLNAGDILDLEVHNAAGNKVYQTFSDSGATTISGTTPALPPGTYSVDVGLFTPSWTSVLHWDTAQTFTIASPYDATQFSAQATPSGTLSLTAQLNHTLPAGWILDFEVYNAAGQKVYQTYSSAGTATLSGTTPVLPPGSYKASIGIFTPNWTTTEYWQTLTATIAPPVLPSVTHFTAKLTATETVTAEAQLSGALPTGDVLDLEVHNAAGQKVYQTYLSNNPSQISGTTPVLPPGTYYPFVGIFSSHWSTSLLWTPEPSFSVPNVSAPVPAHSPITAAMALQAYSAWKTSYVISAGNGMLRVIRPQNNNDTVSEGMGYGMLFAAYAHDRSTFQGLWAYARHYQDANGLMNWKISQSGTVTGTGSASDADEDMAYALGLAAQQWPGYGYHQDFLTLSQAILQHDVLPDHLMGPGDQWGSQNTMVDPSYMDPGYYTQFAQWTGNAAWTTIAETTNTWLATHANSQTGLLPDWLNTNGTAPTVSWDEYPQAFWYDAVRVPMRLEFSAQHGDAAALTLLTKEDAWLKNIPLAQLVAGYTLTGQGLTSYINDTFTAGYTAMAQASPTSAYSLALDQRLWATQPTTYFGASLRLWELFQVANLDS